MSDTEKRLEGIESSLKAISDAFNERASEKFSERLTRLETNVDHIVQTVSQGVEQREKIYRKLDCIEEKMATKGELSAHNERIDVLEKNKIEARGMLRVVAWLSVPVVGIVSWLSAIVSKKLGLN